MADPPRAKPKVSRQPSTEEMARRLAAAAGYGAFDGKAGLAEALGWSARTLTRRGKQTQLLGRDITAIAKITGVPEDFLRYGWEGAKWIHPAQADEDALPENGLDLDAPEHPDT